MGDFRRGLCQPECGSIPPIPARCACPNTSWATKVYAWLWVHFALWGRLGRRRDDRSKNRERWGRAQQALGVAPFFSIQTTKRTERWCFAMGGILGTACDRGGTCQGGILASFGAANRTNRKMVFRDWGNIRDGVQPRRNVSRGNFGIVWGSESLDEKIKKIKSVVALDGHQTTNKNATTNQKRARSN